MSAPVDAIAAELVRDGWTVLRRAVDPSIIGAMEQDLAARFAATPMCQGGFYGERTCRFGSLLTRSPHAAGLVMHQTMLGIAETMLLPWCERLALNLTQAIEIHPGALPQLPHRDQDMWGGPKGGIEYLLNVMWPMTDFTSENGGTRLWTGSHIEQEVGLMDEADAIVPEVGPGDALLFL
jgi:hypothetical protein